MNMHLYENFLMIIKLHLCSKIGAPILKTERCHGIMENAFILFTYRLVCYHVSSL